MGFLMASVEVQILGIFYEENIVIHENYFGPFGKFYVSRYLSQEYLCSRNFLLLTYLPSLYTNKPLQM